MLDCKRVYFDGCLYLLHLVVAMMKKVLDKGVDESTSADRGTYIYKKPKA